MKKIVIYNGGHPRKNDDLVHLNEALVETFADFAVALSPTGILWGCVFSGTGTISWTAGAVIYNLEVYRVSAGSAAGTMSTLRLVLNTTYRTGNPVGYFDGNNRNVHRIDAATFAASGALPSMETLDVLRYGNLLSDKLATHNAFIEVDTLLNSWANVTSDKKFAYRKVIGTVELRGGITSGALDTVVYQLPTGYRPSATRLVQVTNEHLSAYYQYHLIISTDGNVTMKGSGTVGTVYLDGVQFSL